MLSFIALIHFYAQVSKVMFVYWNTGRWSWGCGKIHFSFSHTISLCAASAPRFSPAMRPGILISVWSKLFSLFKRMSNIWLLHHYLYATKSSTSVYTCCIMRNWSFVGEVIMLLCKSLGLPIFFSTLSFSSWHKPTELLAFTSAWDYTAMNVQSLSKSHRILSWLVVGVIIGWQGGWIFQHKWCSFQTSTIEKPEDAQAL